MDDTPQVSSRAFGLRKEHRRRLGILNSAHKQPVAIKSDQASRTSDMQLPVAIGCAGGIVRSGEPYRATILGYREKLSLDVGAALVSDEPRCSHMNRTEDLGQQVDKCVQSVGAAIE
jgi:hypothetical protein